MNAERCFHGHAAAAVDDVADCSGSYYYFG